MNKEINAGNGQEEEKYIATPVELDALKDGKDEIARGDYVTLTELRYDMDSHCR